MRFGILTVSDTCYKKENVDKSGPQIKSLIKKKYVDDIVIYEDIVPDEQKKIREKLEEWSNDVCDVIFTTGGTGISERDVTPEATKRVIDKEVPGISFVMMQKSLLSTPFAMLSRAVCGIRKKTLIVNFPGSVKAVTENFEAICDIIPHAISLLQNKIEDIHKVHKKLASLPPLQPKLNVAPSNVIMNAVANRPRSSPYEMVSVDKALELITLNCAPTFNTEILPIDSVMGRVLAEDVRAQDAHPPFPASIKDGYAVKVADGTGLRSVVDVRAAGDQPQAHELQNGQCIRISTGAPVPRGADAVVQVEDTELIQSSEDSSKELQINIKVPPSFGQDIRPIGSDIPINSIVLQKGNVINAAEVGVLAAVGQIKANVFKRPVVGIISTGNEVQDPSEPLQLGRIRDSNKITIISLLKQYSYESQDCGHAKDDPNSVKYILTKAFEDCDFVITTGGVSMGEFDVLKQVLIQDFSARIHFGRVNMKPGKPTTFATLLYNNKKKMFFGLPGNPVSATVTCLLFVIPALRYYENKKKYLHPKIFVKPNFLPVFDAERPDYQRVKLNFGDEITVDTTGNQISSKLNSFVEADGIMLVEPYKLKKNETRQNCEYYSSPKKYSCFIINKY